MSCARTCSNVGSRVSSCPSDWKCARHFRARQVARCARHPCATSCRTGREVDDFRAWVRAELTARLSPRRAGAHTSVLGAGSDDLATGREYLHALTGSGLAVPSWPKDYGGLDATPEHVGIVRSELAGFALPDLYPYLVGLELVGP